MALHNTAQDVLLAIRNFDQAHYGPAGDAEADAAVAMRDCVLDYLRSNPEASLELADLVDRFDLETERICA